MKILDVVIIALILAVAAAGMVVARAPGRAAASGVSAEIYVDGELTRSLPLDEAGEFVVNTGRGYNRVVVEDGRVRVADADCGALVCVRGGAKSLPGDMIACLPHRLVIKVTGGDAPYDALAY